MAKSGCSDYALHFSDYGLHFLELLFSIEQRTVPLRKKAALGGGIIEASPFPKTDLPKAVPPNFQGFSDPISSFHTSIYWKLCIWGKSKCFPTQASSLCAKNF